MTEQLKAYAIVLLHRDRNDGRYDDETWYVEEYGAFLSKESVDRKVAELNEPAIDRMRQAAILKHQTKHRNTIVRAWKKQNAHLPPAYQTPLVVPDAPELPDSEIDLELCTSSENERGHRHGYYAAEEVVLTA